MITLSSSTRNWGLQKLPGGIWRQPGLCCSAVADGVCVHCTLKCQGKWASFMDWCLWGTHWLLGRVSDSVSSRPLRSQGQLSYSRLTPWWFPIPFPCPYLFIPPRSVDCATNSNSLFTSLQTLLQASDCWHQLKEQLAVPRAVGIAQQLGCQEGAISLMTSLP